MAEDEHWLFAADNDGIPVTVVGITISTNFYLGRHAYVYDLVTTVEERSKRHGPGCSSISANEPPIVTAKPSNSKWDCGATTPTVLHREHGVREVLLLVCFFTCPDRRRSNQPTISANRRSWSR